MTPGILMHPRRKLGSIAHYLGGFFVWIAYGCLIVGAAVGFLLFGTVLWLSGLTPMRKLWPAVVVLVPALIAWLVLR